MENNEVIKKVESKQEPEPKQEQTINKVCSENNNILIDLLIKLNKASSLINLLLDYNNLNVNDINEAIISPESYKILQDNIIKCINTLFIEYQDKMEDFNGQNKAEHK